MFLMNKIILKSILPTLFLFLAQAIFAQNDTVYISFTPTDIKCAETKAITMRVKGFTNIVTMNFSIRYNQDLITLKNYTGATANAQVLANEVISGDFADGQTFSWSKATPATMTDGDFFNFNFDPKAESGGKSGEISFSSMPVSIKFEALVGNVKKVLPYKITNAPFRIVDLIAPKIVCPNSVFVPLPQNENSAGVNGLNATFKDSLCGKATISYNLSGATTGAANNQDATGLTFNVGTTNVLYTTKDNANNSASCQFQVILAKTADVSFFTNAPIVKCTDSTFTVETRVANFKDVTAVDYDFTFDKNVLQFKSKNNLNATVSAGNAGFVSEAFANQGLIKVSFTDVAGYNLPDNTLLFSLTFRKIGGAAAADFVFKDVEVTKIPNASTLAPVQTFATPIPFVDIEAPVLTCPKDTAVYATLASPNSIQMFGIQALATDNCQLEPINYNLTGATTLATTININGKNFNVGVTNVNVNVKDFAGNTKTCNYKVIVRQLEAKIVSDTVDCRADTVMMDLTVRDFINMKKLNVKLDWNKDSLQYRKTVFVAPWAAGTSAIATPNVSGASLDLAFTSANPNGTSLADNQVIARVSYKVLNTKLNDKYKIKPTISLAELANNTAIFAKATDGFLSILDTEGPKIVGCPKDTTIKTNQCFVNYTWVAPQATDFCSAVAVPNTNAPANATALINASIKPMAFFYEFSDAFNNKSRCDFKVTVLDTVKPKINACLTDTLKLATNDLLPNCVAIFPDLTLPTVIENCDRSVSINYKKGDLLPLGTTKYTISVRDSSGNVANCERFVQVTDRTGPSFDAAYFSPPTKILTSDPGKCGADYTWTDPTATDNCGGAVVISADKVKGSFFEVKNQGTPIKFTATDAVGNKTERIFNIVVIDAELPKFVNCPAGKRDTTIYVTSTNCNAVFNAPVVKYTDNCKTGEQNAVLSGAPSNNIYPIGKTELLYTATEPTAFCQFSVTVKDTIRPTIICPSNVTRNAGASICAANIQTLPNPIALTDNCQNSALNYVASPQQIQYPVGTTTITYTARDSSGNETKCTFDVIVIDKIKPVLDCPQTDISLNADADKNSAVANWTEPSATDNCGSNKVQITSNKINGSIFTIGSTAVVYVAKDEAGNTDTCKFNVKVFDTQKPKFTNCPNSAVSGSPIVGKCEVKYTVLNNILATDNHKITFRDSTGSLPNGVYPKGTYNIVYLVRDSSGLENTCSLTLNVVDREAPKATNCPLPDKSFMAQNGSCDYKLNSINDLVFPIFKDNCDVTVSTDTLHWANNTWVKGLPSNLTFKAGETRLAVAAIDAANNKSDTCFFKVIVTGNVKPSISAADCGVGNITQKATGCATTLATPYSAPVVNFSPCSAKDTAFYNFAPNTAFSIGNHIVIYTAKDKIGNTATCFFTVTIEDKDAPTITFAKDTIVMKGADCFQTVIWDAPVVKDFPCDTVKTTLTPLQSWGVFKVGISTMTYTATDKSNNTATKTLYIQVIDNQAPVFSKCPKNVEISIDGTVISDPDNVLDNSKILTNAKCDSIQLAYLPSVFKTSDNCDTSAPILVFPLQYLPLKTNTYAVGETSIKVLAKDKSNNEGPCEFKIIVKPFAANFKATVSDSLPCENDAITLKSDSIAGLKAVWSFKNNTISTKSTTILKNITASQSGTYSIFYEKGNCKSRKDSVRFSVLGPPILKHDTLRVQAGTTENSNVTNNDNLLKNTKYTVTWTVTSSNKGTFVGKEDGVFSFQANKGQQGFVTVLYSICYDDCPTACVKDVPLWIEVTKDVPTDCRIQNLLTPNGDGFNDKLEIDCIGNLSGAKMYIYSQWGEQVYASEDYKNDWDGKWKNKQLPDGTYFYVFQLDPTREMQKGYIVIFR